MAERKSVNKYYPPDWDPSKGSVNKYVGQHPLRDRAKKLGQGILVIRFEMPYNIWCGGCNSHIGMGVRYNAEKSKVGNYYTTPIYKFRMKCHLCDNYFEIQTDPKNHDYVILEGARRKEQRWDPKENEQIVPEDKATQKKMATDAMFNLEHGSDDKAEAKKRQSNLSQLELRQEVLKDDYMLNKLARNKFRHEKTSIRVNNEADNALLAKSSLEIPLLQETESDKKLAGLLKYRALESFDDRKATKRKEIESRPLFVSPKKARQDTFSPDKLDIIKKQLKPSSASIFDSHTKKIHRSSNLTKATLGIKKKVISGENSDSSSISSDGEIRTSDEQSDCSEKHIDSFEKPITSNKFCKFQEEPIISEKQSDSQKVPSTTECSDEQNYSQDVVDMLKKQIVSNDKPSDSDEYSRMTYRHRTSNIQCDAKDQPLVSDKHTNSLDKACGSDKLNDMKDKLTDPELSTTDVDRSTDSLDTVAIEAVTEAMPIKGGRSLLCDYSDSDSDSSVT